MINKKLIREQWSSRMIYILAVIGSAVGLGNIWKFPYITGENGGGVFVIVYLVCVVIIGIPIMIAETMLGRRGKKNPIDTMRLLAIEANASDKWKYLGWMGVVTGVLILSYYSVIAGWVIVYVFKALAGFASDISVIKASFDDLIHSPMKLVFWHTIFMIVTTIVTMRGVKNGLEKTIQLLVPALLALLILLVAYAMTYEDAFLRGLNFLFSLDFSAINGNSVLIAMGHAFFTLSLGMGAIMVYGSYLPAGISIVQTSLYIAVVDTVVALLAGMAIFPLVFANGLEPSSGPGLIFQTLPIAFSSMNWLFGFLFFVLLLFATLTSAISLLEPVVSWITENTKWSRVKASVISSVAIWFLGISVAFSFNIWSHFKVFDKTIFDLLDYLTANLMLPIGGFGITIFAGWVMQKKHAKGELNIPEQLFKLWHFLIRYVATAAIFIVFLYMILE